MPGPRASYSSLICLGCRERRIRCELPSEVDVPASGELRTVQTPCYRCKRLGIPCVVRQTILGRPGAKSKLASAADPRRAQQGHNVSRVIVELPARTVARAQIESTNVADETQNRSLAAQSKLCSPEELPPRREEDTPRNGKTLLLHQPQSSETVIIIRALDTIQCENVEEAWPRHLVVRVGHIPALDLSIKAIVAACAYARGVPKLTPNDCYQALALALTAVQTNIKQSQRAPNDDMLASTALLAPFDGVMKRHDIPMRLHVEGLAAILTARPATYPVTQLARDILDFYACDSTIMACIQGTPSPFESVPRAYYANNREGYSDGDRAQLRALGIELFIRLPRLVGMVGSLRFESPPQGQLLEDALRLSESLLGLQDSKAEARLLSLTRAYSSKLGNAMSSLHQSLSFTSDLDFEALVCYWQSRLSLLRLDWWLRNLFITTGVQASPDDPEEPSQPSFDPSVMNEISQLVKNLLICVAHGAKLRLRKRRRLFAHAMIVVWGVMMDIPMVLTLDRNGEGTSWLFHLLLRSTNVALAATPPLSAEDLDMAAGIFTGGCPQGRYAELYGLQST